MAGRLAIPILASALLAGCGGGGSSAPPSVPLPVVAQSPGGMWFATTSANSSTTLMIAETGEAKIMVAAPPSAGVAPSFGAGAVLVTGGNRIAGSYEIRTVGFAGAELDCTLEGTVNTRVSIQITTRCTDAGGVVTNASLNFLYDARYDAPSSLAEIAGNYTMPTNTLTNSLNINGDGTLFGMFDNGARCTINGRVEIINSSFNLYRFEVLLSSCTVAPWYNGITMSGLATRNLPGQPPGAFFLLMTGFVGGRLEFFSVVYQRS